MNMCDLVTLERFEQLSGYSVGAQRIKMSRGVWLEGRVWFRAPDGKPLISIAGYEQWAKGEASHLPVRAAS
jgi:hypothetical protein